MLARQVLEVEALQATFPEDGAVVLSDAERNALTEAQALFDLPEEAANDSDRPLLSGTVYILDCKLHGRPVGMRFQLPRRYPEDGADVLVICDTDRASHDSLTAAAAKCLEANRGSEVLLLTLEALREAAEGIPDKQAVAPLSERKTAALPPRLNRKLVWFHHIKSTSKRKDIVNWAHDLNVRGYSKPGFPGIVICEGLEDDVQEYCARIRALRWQAMSVRAEEADEASAWRFDGKFQELGEGDMHVLAAECRAAGLEHLFNAALKL